MADDSGWFNAMEKSVQNYGARLKKKYKIGEIPRESEGRQFGAVDETADVAMDTVRAAAEEARKKKLRDSAAK